MHELRSCDFCTGDAVGTFAIVPPELEPTEAEQRRVVCCPDCKERLESLLEPLIARAGTDANATADLETNESVDDHADPTVTTSADESDSDDEHGTVATANESTQRTSSPHATVSDIEVGDADDSDTDSDATDATDATNATDATDSTVLESGTGNTDRSTDTSDSSDTDSDAETGSVLEGGISFEQSEPTEMNDESERTAADEEDTDDGDNNETDDDRTTNTTADESATQNAETRPPKAYGKVIRLLKNRHFPMQRSAVEELASGAYDLEPHEAEAVVDYALAQGKFVERSEMLERPEN